MSGLCSILSRRTISALLVLLFSCSALMFGVDEAGGRKVKNHVPLAYPEMAKKLGLTGVVKLEVLVAPNGDVRNVKVLGGNPLLAEAAVTAVKQWKYEAGDESKLVVDVKFNLVQ